MENTFSCWRRRRVLFIITAWMAPSCGGAADILGCCSERHGQAGEIGQDEVVGSTMWSSARNMNSWSRVTPCTGAGWGLSDWGAALQRRIWGFWPTRSSRVPMLCWRPATDWAVFSSLALVRPYLEYCDHVRVLQCKKDTDEQERVHSVGATKMKEQEATGIDCNRGNPMWI